MEDKKMDDKDFVKRFAAELVRLHGSSQMPHGGTAVSIYANGAAPAYREPENDPALVDDPEAAARADFTKWGEPVPQREIPRELAEPTPIEEPIPVALPPVDTNPPTPAPEPAPEPAGELPADAKTTQE